MPPSGHEFMCGTVVGRVQDDRVVGDAELGRAYRARVPDVLVVVDHRVVVRDCQRPAWPRLSGFGCVRKCMWVVLIQRRTACPPVVLALDEVDARVERTRRRSSPYASSSAARCPRCAADRRVIHDCGARPAGRTAPGSSGSPRRSGSRVLRLLLGVQVVEVAEELVEAVRRRQVLVAVAEVVLAELAGGVAERLQQLGDRRIVVVQPVLGPGRPTLLSPVRNTLCPVIKADRPRCSSARRTRR